MTWDDEHLRRARGIPTIGERLESIEALLTEIRDLLKAHAENDPLAVLNAALKAEQEAGRDSAHGESPRPMDYWGPG